jgi:hypothetical protein
MADPIKLDENQDWARDTTLENITKRLDQTNKLISSLSPKRTGAVKSLEQDAENASTSLKRVSREGKNVSDATETYWKALNDLRQNTYKVSGTFKSIITATDPLKGIPDSIERGTSHISDKLIDTGGKLSGFGKALSTTGAIAVATLGAAFAHTARVFLEAGDSYRTMIESGVLFGGSITDFATTVRGAGISFQTSTQIVSKYGATLQMAGEKNFFETVSRMEDKFAGLGMTMDQGTEAMADLMDQQRLTGMLAGRSERERIQTNTELMNIMQQQSILTGKSVKEQMAASRQMAERKSYEVLLRTLSPQQRITAEKLQAQMAARGFSPEQIMGTMMMALGRGTTRAGAQFLIPTGQAGVNFIKQLQTSFQTGITDNLESAFADVGSSYQNFIKNNKALALSMENGTGTLAQLGDSSLNLALASEKTSSVTDDHKDEAERARQGLSVLTDQTKAYYKTINDLSRLIGERDAAVVKLATDNLGLFYDKIKSIADLDKVGGFAIEHPIMSMAAMAAAQITSQFLGNMLLKGGGAVFSKVFSTVAGATTSVVEEVAKSAELASIEGAAGAAAIARIAKMAARIAKGATGVGILGVGAELGGDYLKSKGYTKSGATMDVLGKGAEYAAMGALLGPWGAAIGGAAGLGVGLYQNWGDLFGNNPKAQAAATEDHRDTVESFQDDLTKIMADGFNKVADKLDLVNNSLSTNGDLWKLLNELTEQTDEHHRKLRTTIINQ